MTEYKAGDLVTIRLDSYAADRMNGNPAGIAINYQWIINHIIKHEPAPFDWKDVKPGMAFYCGECESLMVYIGPNPFEPDVAYFKWKYDGLINNYRKEYCKRAPSKYDIKVKS